MEIMYNILLKVYRNLFDIHCCVNVPKELKAESEARRDLLRNSSHRSPSK